MGVARLAGVGGVIVGEDGSILSDDVKEVHSTHLHTATEVVVGCSRR